MKKYFFLLTVTIIFVSNVFSQSDDYPTVGDPSTNLYCPNLTSRLVRGNTDNNTNGQVSELQKFLRSYFDLTDNQLLVTGLFGRLTQNFVITFQKENGLPAYGIVGSVTRSKIASKCSQVVPPNPEICPQPMCPESLILCEAGYVGVPAIPKYDSKGCRTNTCEQGKCVKVDQDKCSKKYANTDCLQSLVVCSPGFHPEATESIYDDEGCKKVCQPKQKCVKDKDPVFSDICSFRLQTAGACTMNVISCLPGTHYEAPNPEFDVDKCSTDPCYNRGSCVQDTGLECIFNGKKIGNGRSVKAFKNEAGQTNSIPPSYFNSCSNEIRTCRNGVLSGSFQDFKCN